MRPNSRALIKDQNSVQSGLGSLFIRLGFVLFLEERVIKMVQFKNGKRILDESKRNTP